MPKFNLEEKNLMLIQGLTFFANALAGIFVTVFFFSHSDIRTTVLFNVVTYISLLVFYVLSGLSLRFVSSAFLIRIGVVSAAAFYLLLFVLGVNAVNFAVALGLLWGFSAGNFWVGINLNTFVFANKESRVTFFGSMSGIINFIEALGPLIGGLIIMVTRTYRIFDFDTGYAALFFVVFLLLSLTVVVIGNLPSHGVPNFSYRHIWEHKRSQAWQWVLWQSFIMGLYDVVLGIVTGILLYLVLKGELFLGIAQTGSYVLAALGSLLSVRLLIKNPNYFWIGVVGVVFGYGFFALEQNLLGAVVFVAASVFGPFANNWLSTAFFQTVDVAAGSWQEKFHYLIERDATLGIARVLSCLLLFVFLQFGDQVTVATWFLYVLAFMPLVLGIFLSRSVSSLV